MPVYILSNRQIKLTKDDTSFTKDNYSLANFRIAKCDFENTPKVTEAEKENKSYTNKKILNYKIYAEPETQDYKNVLEVLMAEKKLLKSKLTANNLGGTQRMFYELYKNMSSAGKKSNDVLIFIHGFAHSFDDELETIQQLKKIYIDNKYSPIENIIFVSWPSSITVFPLTYFDDKGASINAGHSLMRLFYLYTQFLSDVFSNPDLRPCNQKIHLMAHSMGNRVLQSMLYSLKKENIKRVIDQVLLLNADVSFRVFEDDENSFNKLPLLANRISIYVNKGDDILGLSQFSKNILTARLGKAGPSNVDKFKDVLSIIDCTKVKNDILTSFKFEIGDHWGYLSSSQVQKDILANLNGIDQTLIANRSKVKDYVFSIDSLS